jgi:type VI secretion system secreted protein VgrG
MKIESFKLAGEDVSKYFRGLTIKQSIGASHDQFYIRISREDRAGHFKSSLLDVSQKWIGEKMEVGDLFKGIVTSVALSRSHAGGSDFVVTGQSPTVLLDDGIHTRSFGEKTLQQIVDTVISPYEGKFDGVDIKTKQGKIKYCVQYRESNYAFLNRLASRYGEWFYFDGKKLVFGKPPKGGAIRLNFPADVTYFDLAVKAVPVNFNLKIYDYKKHEFPKKKSDYPAPSNPLAQIALNKSKSSVYPEYTDIPINVGMDEADLEKIKKLKQNVHLNELVVFTGASTSQELRLGSVVKIPDNREELVTSGTDDYGEFIITHLTHEFSTHGESYRNHFEAIPKDAEVPPITAAPEPPYCEVQEAEVLENNDPKGLGRVRVQFHWQKELKGDDSKTNWIRVVSNSAGGTKGLYILPEKKDTVLVAFEHDNPERPYILTSTYHGTAKPEHHDPQNWKKALKTKGGHQFLMNDEKGKEKMDFFSPKDFSAVAKAGKMALSAATTITIVSDGGNISIKTPKDIAMDADGNITITAKGDITLKAKNIKLEGETSISLKAPKIDIAADMELTAKGTTVKVEGSATTDVKGATVNVDGSVLTSISGAIVKIN